MRFLRDVGGVPGLSVLLDALSEAEEQALFFLALFGCGATWRDRAHASQYADLEKGPLPELLYCVMNRVVDSGLHPQLLPADFVRALQYPCVDFPSVDAWRAAHALHTESSRRLGETVVGVGLGNGCQMTFQPHKRNLSNTLRSSQAQDHGLKVELFGQDGEHGQHVNVHLPRRCIYLMAGSARIDFKHAILNIHRFPAEGCVIPDWNTSGARRSLTLFATKPYADALLMRQRDAAAPGSAKRAELDSRLAASRKFRAIYTVEGSGGKVKVDESRIPGIVSSKLALLEHISRPRPGGLPGLVHSRFPSRSRTECQSARSGTAVTRPTWPIVAAMMRAANSHSAKSAKPPAKRAKTVSKTVITIDSDSEPIYLSD
jgi:hypothetical protein